MVLLYLGYKIIVLLENKVRPCHRIHGPFVVAHKKSAKYVNFVI
jgi:hypothetical protein